MERTNHLLRHLVRAALAESETAEATTSDAIAGAPAEAWAVIERDLELHRINSLVGMVCGSGSLHDAMPAGVRERLVEAHGKTGLTNHVLMLATARALAALRERGVEPVAWKGIVLADHCYPDPGGRWMGDVDFSIEADEVEATKDAFASIGMRCPDALQTTDALYFENAMGIMFDVHHRVRLFEGHDADAIASDITPTHMPAPSLRVLEPNAMLVHLIVHMDGHRDEMGYLLSWLVDIAFFMRRWGDDLDRDRLAALMPEGEHWASLLCTLRFLEREFDVAPPPCLAALTAGVETFDLDYVMRERRRAPWGLDGPRAWARFLAHRFLGRTIEDMPTPTFDDLRRWPADKAHLRRVLAQPIGPAPVGAVGATGESGAESRAA
jgi:hypothetical protein